MTSRHIQALAVVRRLYGSETGTFTLPKDHLFGMWVPEGGSSCAKCKFVSDDKKHCGNQYFRAWQESLKATDPSELPEDAERYCCDVFQASGKRTEAAAKVDFYTPATFKHAAEQFSQVLTSTTGFPWKVDELKKSNRKTIHGQELYIEAKVYPVDRTKTVGAELAASLTSPSDYWYQVIIHQRTKTVLEVSHKAQKFQDLTHLVSSFSVPSHISETLKQASVVERVASRFLRQI